RAAADQPGRDDGDSESLQRTRDVDALAAGERDAVARAMPLPPLEVRNGQCPVDRRVECASDDHQKRFPRWWSVLPVVQRTRPSSPGLLIVPQAAQTRVPTRRDPRLISTRPRTSPCRTGSETALRATTVSVSGRPI